MINKNYKNSKRKDEFDSKIIDIRRTARVVSGGRRFSFRVAIVVGNRKGEAGIGMGKSDDTSTAIEKATRQAKKNIVRPKLTKENSLPYAIESKFSSARVLIRPSFGHGLVAGSSVRTVLDLAGIRGVNAKVLSRSKNKLNNARAAIKALKRLE